MAWVECFGQLTDVFNPLFSETEIADNSLLNLEITFSESWDNFNLLKIDLINDNDTTTINSYYVTPGQINFIKTNNYALGLFFDSSASCSYTLGNSSWTKKNSSNLGNIYKIYGLTATNCSPNEIIVYNDITTPTKTVNYNNGSFYNFDLIFTLNKQADGLMTPNYSFIIPTNENKPLYDRNCYFLLYDYSNNDTGCYITEHQMRIVGLFYTNFLYISGLKYK